MRPLRDEFKTPLPKVHRAWLRRSVLVLLLPLFLFIAVLEGLFGALVKTAETIRESW